jgi:hypothetical protein
MRRILPFLAAALLAAPAAAANLDTPPRGVAAAFGNTIRAIYPDGRYQRLWLHADGSWDALGRRGYWSGGKWSLKESKVCLRQTRPFPAPFKYCTDFPEDGGVGVVWTSRSMDGEPIRLTVVKGMDRP